MNYLEEVENDKEAAEATNAANNTTVRLNRSPMNSK